MRRTGEVGVTGLRPGERSCMRQPLPVALNSRLPNQILCPAGSGSETPMGYGLDLPAIPGDQMGKREKMSRSAPLPGAPTVGVPTRGSGSQRVNAACFLVPDDDARGNTVMHGLSWFRPRGRTSSKGGVRGHCIILHRSACSRGYKPGERGRKAPKSLLEVESVEMSV